VKSAHGLKGELFIVLYAGEAAWLEALQTLQLIPPAENPLGPSSTPYQVRSARRFKNGILVQTHEVLDRTKAEALKGWRLLIPREFLVAKSGEQPYLIEILGFQVDDEWMGADLGQIVGFSSNGAQDLLVVETSESGRFEIPFVQAFVKKLDQANKRVLMSLPLGLVPEDLEAKRIKQNEKA